jgi:hypothetical protein
MTRRGPGQFNVLPGERVTVVITKEIAPYSATTTEIFGGAAWSPQPDNSGSLTASGGFDVPAAMGGHFSFGVLCNFVPSPATDTQADFYTITLSGNGGGSFPFFADPPGASTKVFEFFS